MKIRLATVLLAAVFVSLPSAIAAETNEPSFKTSYYDRTATLQITDWCSPNYVDPPQMTVWHDHYDEFYYNPPRDMWHWNWADTWVCREYCEKHFTFITWPDANSMGTKHRWGYGADAPGGGYDPCLYYDETVEEDAPGEITFMGRKNWTHYNTRPDGYVWDQRYWEVCLMNLLTGGTVGVTNANNFVRVIMSVKDLQNGQFVPSSGFTLWGRSRDTNTVFYGGETSFMPT